MTEPKALVAYGQRCLLCRNDAAASRVICWKHIDDIRDMLDVENEGNVSADLPPSIPVLYAELDATPGPSALGERRAPGYASSAPVRLHVVAMQDERSRSPEYEGDDTLRSVPGSMRGIVESVRGEMDEPPPILNATVGGLCRWLTAHLHVVSRLPWADDLYRDLRSLSVQLRAAHGDRPPRPVGYCTNVITTAGERDGEHVNAACGHALFPPAGTTPAAPGESVRDVPVIVCGRCGARYDGLAQLRLRITELKGNAE